MGIRSRGFVRVAVIGLASAAISLSACSAEPGPGTGGGTGWVAAGCVPGNQAGSTVHPDINFSGTPNVRGNGVLSGNWSNGQFVVSADGSCSGAQFAAMTIVRAADQGAATAACTALNAGNDPAKATTGSGYNLPADAWVCSETYYL